MSAPQEDSNALNELRKNVDRLKFILYSSPVIFYTSEPRDKYAATFISENVRDQLGYESQEFIENPKFWVDHIHPEDKIQILTNLPTILEHNHYRCEYRFQHKNGDYRWMLDEMNLIRDENGKPVEIVGYWTDITERKQMEEKNRELRELFEKAFANINEVVFIVEPVTRTIIASNKAIEKIFGYTEKEVIGRNTEFLHVNKEMYERFVKELTPILDSKRTFHSEFQLRRKDGSVFFSEHTITDILDSSGRCICNISVVRDITEHKKVEESLRLANAYNRSLIEVSLDPLVTISPDGRITDVNHATENIIGYLRGQLIGTDFANYFTEPEKARAGYQQVFNAGIVQDYPLELKHRNGNITPVLYNASTYCDESGKVIGVFAAARDITRRKHTEEVLIKYTNRLIILHALDRAILAAQSVEEIVKNSLKYIRKLILYNRASVATFNIESGLATLLVVDTSSRTKLGSGAQIPLEVFGKIEKLRQGKLHIVEDLQALPQMSPIIKIFLEEGIRSYVFIPLVYKNNLIGSLNLGSNSPGRFAAEDVEIAREVADLLTIALQQAMLFKEVNEHRERLRALSHRLTEAEEEERKKLTRDLHDKVGQNLTALSINLNIMNTMLSSESKIRIESRLNDSQKLLEEITIHIRNVMADLRPVILDEYGLLSALHWYCDRFSNRTGIAMKVHGHDLKPPLPSIVETILFRVTQELLTNISKHACAHQVTVTLNEIKEKIQLSVTDDGVGFDLAILKNNFTQRKGWGLLSAREQIESIGGHLSIKSTTGKGTDVTIEAKR